MTKFWQRPTLFNTAVLLAAVLLIFWRMPYLITQPRFWAEEGGVFFGYAYAHPWYETLVFVPSYLGYLCFYYNIVVLAATFVPLAYAPLVTTLACLLVQLVSLAIILWSKSSFWDSRPRKVLACLFLTINPLAEDIWLTTTTCQFYFCLITFLLLLEESENSSNFKKWAYRGLLLMAGLTGPVSCFLTPFFFFRAWRDKNREYWIQAGILAVCAVLQFICLLANLAAPGSLTNKRVVAPDVPTIIAIIWNKTLIQPIAGPSVSQGVGESLRELQISGQFGFFLLAMGLFLVGFFLLEFISSPLDLTRRIIFLGSYLTLLILSIITSIEPKAALINAGDGRRYFYVPSCIVLILLLGNLRFDKNLLKTLRSGLCVVVLLGALVSGLLSYERLSTRPDLPVWQDEVTCWQINPDYAPQTWPQGWWVRLEKP